jgi:hypothetical protein
MANQTITATAPAQMLFATSSGHANTGITNSFITVIAIADIIANAARIAG